MADARGRVGEGARVRFFTGCEKMVGPARFELTTSCTPCKRSTRLNYGPTFSAPEGARAEIVDGKGNECN